MTSNENITFNTTVIKNLKIYHSDFYLANSIILDENFISFHFQALLINKGHD